MRKVYSGIKNLIIGLFTTGKHLGRHAITVQYPTERWPMPERSRGIVVLLSDKETGELNCTTCLLCMRACPSAAIRIDYDKDEKGKRILKDFVVDQGLCCFCGLCEEACNFSAIKMATKYEFSTYKSENLIWHTDKLQEIGRDVPYQKPERKKPEAKPAAPKPAAAPNPAPADKKEPEKKENPDSEVNDAN
ncbi:NADH-quinone oxidoreductase subunit I (modular protein) [Candidatus Zixiibacteriota bacterium]|nr:NADH-quinone oxidoreductase subunit I (modular protein) [candidate division Zixibacteria bacterium]